MEAITQLQTQFEQHKAQIIHYAVFLGILLFGVLFLSSLFRFLFGKKAQINRAVSSAMEILCLYIINIVIYSLGVRLEIFLAPLPFVQIQGDFIHIYPIFQAEFTDLCSKLLKILIIALLVNVVNDWIPKGKHWFSWYFFRLLTVAIAVGINYAADWLLSLYLPQGLTEYAPTVLMVSLVALVLLGSLKLLTGLALAFLDPIIAALYTFFFSNYLGRQLARALLTTILLTAIVAVLNYLGLTSFFIAAAALPAYIPVLAILLLLWYIVGHLL